MTVKELIEKLKEMPEDADVMLDIWETDYIWLEDVSLVTNDTVVITP